MCLRAAVYSLWNPAACLAASVCACVCERACACARHLHRRQARPGGADLGRAWGKCTGPATTFPTLPVSHLVRAFAPPCPPTTPPPPCVCLRAQARCTAALQILSHRASRPGWSCTRRGASPSSPPSPQLLSQFTPPAAP